MAAATFAMSAISIVGSSVIDDLNISREELGYVATANILLAALFSPWAGNVVDRIGGRRGFAAVFLFGGIAFGLIGVGVAYWVLLIGAVFAAVAQATGNPATNKLIALYVRPGRRAVITGLKQSGVQAMSFVGGLVLPIGAETIGWRPTFLVAAALTVVLIAPALRVVPDDRGDPEVLTDRALPMPQSTRWLAGYGAMLGFGGGATFFVPLFAEEAVGYGARGGGLAAAVIGLAGFAGRIVWARFAERGDRFIFTLGAIAVLSIAASPFFLLSTRISAFLWLGAVIIGVSANSWNSVAMLAVMRDAGPQLAGRASGRVLFGFLLGMGIGPPIYGRTIDVTGSYALMWWLSIAASVAGVVLIWAWSRSVAAARNADKASPDAAGEGP